MAQLRALGPLQKTRIQDPEPTWQLKNIHASSRGSGALFWPPCALTHMWHTHIHAGAHSYKLTKNESL